MKYLIKTFALLTVISLLFGIKAGADSKALNWYIEKRGNECPGFPKEAEMVQANGGYYVDMSKRAKSDKILYLTFDTGYENGNVAKILDILKEEGVPGAFFILGNLIVKDTEVVKRMFDEGHIVANHTKNHKDMTTLTSEEMTNNLHALETLCEEKTGHNMSKYFRFPEGRYDERTISHANSLGYKTFFWSLAYADWDNSHQPSADKSVKKLLDNTHDGAVILLHPTSETNVRILPLLIKEWRRLGYTFGTLDDLVKNMNS